MEKQYTIYDIKRMAKRYGFHFYQAKDYCYFFPFNDNPVMLVNDSVAVCHWSQVKDFGFWEEELIDKIEEMSDHFFQEYNHTEYYKYYQECNGRVRKDS